MRKKKSSGGILGWAERFLDSSAKAINDAIANGQQHTFMDTGKPRAPAVDYKDLPAPGFRGDGVISPSHITRLYLDAQNVLHDGDSLSAGGVPQLPILINATQTFKSVQLSRVYDWIYGSMLSEANTISNQDLVFFRLYLNSQPCTAWIPFTRFLGQSNTQNNAIWNGPSIITETFSAVGVFYCKFDQVEIAYFTFAGVPLPPVFLNTLIGSEGSDFNPLTGGGGSSSTAPFGLDGNAVQDLPYGAVLTSVATRTNLRLNINPGGNTFTSTAAAPTVAFSYNGSGGLAMGGFWRDASGAGALGRYQVSFDGVTRIDSGANALPVPNALLQCWGNMQQDQAATPNTYLSDADLVIPFSSNITITQQSDGVSPVTSYWKVYKRT